MSISYDDNHCTTGVIAWLEFELVCSDVAVQHVNHYITETCLNECWRILLKEKSLYWTFVCFTFCPAIGSNGSVANTRDQMHQYYSFFLCFFFRLLDTNAIISRTYLSNIDLLNISRQFQSWEGNATFQSSIIRLKFPENEIDSIRRFFTLNDSIRKSLF